MQSTNLKSSSSTYKPTSQACKDKDSLNICLSSSISRLSSSETTELKTTISNKTNRDISQTFSCTFTEPSILLNDKDLSMGVICGQAITSKAIKANSTESFIYKLTGSKMQTGANKIKSSWGSFESGVVTVQKNEETGEEVADQFKACQSLKDNIDFNDVPGYCVSINVVLKNSDAGQYSCANWKGLFKKVNLSIPCTSVMDIGVGYIYVPRNIADKYLAQVKSLPEVDSASIDNQ